MEWQAEAVDSTGMCTLLSSIRLPCLIRFPVLRRAGLDIGLPHALQQPH